MAYELNNYGDRLALRLYIGPGEKVYRESLFNYLSLKKELFPYTNRTLSPKWHCVYQKEFLKKKDFEEKEYEELQEIIDTKWNEFIHHQMKEIDDYIDKWQGPS